MGVSILEQLCLHKGQSLWSAKITDNMQGTEIDGLYGVVSNVFIGWIKWQDFHRYLWHSLLWAPLIGFSRALFSFFLSAHHIPSVLCLPFFPLFLLYYITPIVLYLHVSLLFRLWLCLYHIPFLFSHFHFLIFPVWGGERAEVSFATLSFFPPSSRGTASNSQKCAS